ncbi:MULTISPECIES: S24 family peptidase [Niastella]|uniref:S24 family peptidase n=1 Tax=Niastella soli TaxID=2821487 RepID=A0ABS3YNR4_9BACT|nr:S24 family peptidase [Niastella soli]MBO9199529.1 S24 family peptidase [Niastella soli]
MTDIGFRLKVFRMRSGTKMHMVEKSTGIAKAKLYKWEKGIRPNNIEAFNKLNAYLEEMESKQSAGDISMITPATLILPLKNNRPAKPQVDGKSASGTIIFTGLTPELIVDRIDAPFLGVFEGAIQVTGNGMEPTFSNGCWVTITRLNDFQALNWGYYYYLIDSNYMGYVRRVCQSEKENILRLESDNPDQLRYPPIERSLDKIMAIFKIGASITKF